MERRPNSRKQLTSNQPDQIIHINVHKLLKYAILNTLNTLHYIAPHYNIYISLHYNITLQLQYYITYLFFITIALSSIREHFLTRVFNFILVAIHILRMSQIFEMEPMDDICIILNS